MIPFDMPPNMTLEHSTLPHQIAHLVNLLEQAAAVARAISQGRAEMPVPQDQAWFWSKGWQAGEREVDSQLANGEYDVFTNVDDLLADLDHHTTPV